MCTQARVRSTLEELKRLNRAEHTVQENLLGTEDTSQDPNAIVRRTGFIHVWQVPLLDTFLASIKQRLGMIYIFLSI